MSVEDGLLGDICAKPHDDAPRLIYADWLEEQAGQADRDRAEFIRVQIALEAETEEGPRRWDLQDREKALLEAYGALWSADLRSLALREVYRRGFVEDVTLA